MDFKRIRGGIYRPSFGNSELSRDSAPLIVVHPFQFGNSRANYSLVDFGDAKDPFDSYLSARHYISRLSSILRMQKGGVVVLGNGSERDEILSKISDIRGGRDNTFFVPVEHKDKKDDLFLSETNWTGLSDFLRSSSFYHAFLAGGELIPIRKDDRVWFGDLGHLYYNMRESGIDREFTHACYKIEKQ